MSKTILVTGGARSGKSRIAEEMALGLSRPATYIATAEAWDDEMRARIAAHQARRGTEWQTLHAPRDLCAALAETDAPGAARLVDCLTLWLTNLMLAGGDDAPDLRAETERLMATLKAQAGPVVLVSNEVGMGIVPDTALGRAFRDAQGSLNQAVAATADEVYLAVSGLPLKVK
ncbi:bifunctional adenosylcobinamide kinase/adenosylcobinamide-phosphate guanylyltransferase [Pseudaestuariivita atlantica]|uniref:Bifunctional adenosylcobalamin biosynthesis protein n=1 Tax=Pseudaestuariivita atlantica TaxID=1317121 RepID=A0A0L1JQK0_9RHOB|nr:bifunctional adenosylcobinamide kinase/adenosylcobinamide-phosphate guanylyltransferase [Pseudaestuariivita atlantica]KNG94011.1 adenosylcobinamide kinase [Pseudaestuariivita atlantica]